jgi:hypothetical protein
MKRCTKCRGLQDESHFSTNNARHDGLCTQCKNCQKFYRLTNRDQIEAYQANWREQHPDYQANYYTTKKMELNVYIE